MVSKLSRRQFLAGSAAAALAAQSASASAQEPGAPDPSVELIPLDQPGVLTPTKLQQRADNAFLTRMRAAQLERAQAVAQHPANGDEALYPEKVGTFTKTLPHNQLGEVDPDAYGALIDAIESGEKAAFEAIPQGGPVALTNPQAAYAFDLSAPDPYQLPLDPAPSLASPQAAAEMVEVYWHALLRDVGFDAYEGHPVVESALVDLSRLVDFRAPKVNGRVTSKTLFRANTPGDLAGPYLSQFLYQPIPFGAHTIEQRNQTTVAGVNHMTAYDLWLAVQNGNAPETQAFDDTPRYLRNGRDLAEFVHQDFPGQAFLHAALILMGMGAPFDPNNPYLNSRTQKGFVLFDVAHVLNMVTYLASCALKAAWFHKWLVNRRLRPEAFAGLIHNQRTGAKAYLIHNEALFAKALEEVQRRYGTYLLPMAYAEGCPTHPSYPAGHATISGACATVLKAFFDEDYVLPDPVAASADGLSLIPYRGDDLTVGGELNKLASNISLGRDFAGVHYRSDGIKGMELGEALAMGFLAELKLTYHEPFEGFSFKTFDGAPVTV